MVAATTATTTQQNGEQHPSSPPLLLLPTFVQTYLESVLGEETVKMATIVEAKSAQQQVLIVSWPYSAVDQHPLPLIVPSSSMSSSSSSSSWQDALQTGRNTLVVRVWKASARWWNLHCCDNDNNKWLSSSLLNSQQQQQQHDDVVTLARAEVAAYQMARRAFVESSSSSSSVSSTQKNIIEIPQVLYFSLHDVDNNNTNTNNNKKSCGTCSTTDDNEDDDSFLQQQPQQQEPPWAILSYVGPDCAFFHQQQQEQRQQYKFTNEWITTMIQIRHEFGFDEPHPRWGRVPIDKCLDYVFCLLQQFILPMHTYFFLSTTTTITTTTSVQQQPQQPQQQLDWTHLGISSSSSTNDDDDTTTVINKPWTYATMIDLYQQVHWRIVQELTTKTKTTKTTTNNRNVTMIMDDEVMIQQRNIIVNTLGKCIEQLQAESNCILNNTMPPVLVHMDCQPQNCIYYNNTFDNDNTTTTTNDASKQPPPPPILYSVLDWEEAAYADPRFEILLLSRKVCANRQQANAVWAYYTQQVEPLLLLQLQHVQVGPIEPWLKLEAVHSLMTLLLQSMDLGGRNPWEQKPDLFGKMEREFLRLGQLGWTFCNDAITTTITATTSSSSSKTSQ